MKLGLIGKLRSLVVLLSVELGVPRSEFYALIARPKDKRAQLDEAFVPHAHKSFVPSAKDI